jgi:hypothetical protein
MAQPQVVLVDLPCDGLSNSPFTSEMATHISCGTITFVLNSGTHRSRPFEAGVTAPGPNWGSGSNITKIGPQN